MDRLARDRTTRSRVCRAFRGMGPDASGDNIRFASSEAPFLEGLLRQPRSIQESQ